MERPTDEAATMRLLTRRLVRDYADRYPDAYVESVVAAACDRLATARVRSYLPILVNRMAREVLDSAKGSPTDPR